MSGKRKKIIFHAGVPKTGSSALQTYFSANVEALSAIGIDYPHPEAEALIKEKSCTGNLVQIAQSNGLMKKYFEYTKKPLQKFPLIYKYFSKDILNSLREISLNSDKKLIIYSSESLVYAGNFFWDNLKEFLYDFDMILYDVYIMFILY